MLEVYCDRKQLALQTALRNCEVDIGDQAAAVGRNLHELVSGSQIKSKLRIVVNRLFSDLYDLSWTLLDQVSS